MRACVCVYMATRPFETAIHCKGKSKIKFRGLNYVDVLPILLIFVFFNMYTIKVVQLNTPE